MQYRLRVSFPERLCKGFYCRKNGFCIASILRCDKHPNCGHGDNSDEDQTCRCSFINSIVIHGSKLHILYLERSFSQLYISFRCNLIFHICQHYRFRAGNRAFRAPSHFPAFQVNLNVMLFCVFRIDRAVCVFVLF